MPGGKPLAIRKIRDRYDKSPGGLRLRQLAAETRERLPSANEAVCQHDGGSHGGGREQCEENDAEHIVVLASAAQPVDRLWVRCG